MSASPCPSPYCPSLRILLTGADGQVGWELRRTLAPVGRVIAMGRKQLDLADPDQIRAKVREARPHLIVNAAAYTAVDKAEEEPELARKVNAEAPGILAEEALRRGSVLVHYSTDYVFDGTQTGPYTESDPCNPQSVYGETKLAGERAVEAVGGVHLVLRTSWVYGTRGHNFLRTMLRLAEEREALRIVDDQTGSPTWCRMLAEATAQLLAKHCSVQGRPPLADLSGVYHLSAAGETTWFGFVQAIMALRAQAAEAVGVSVRTPKLIPIPTEQYPTPARRPRYSVLSNQRFYDTFGLYLPEWDDQLRLAVAPFPGVEAA